MQSNPIHHLLLLLCFIIVVAESAYYLDPRKVVFMDASPAVNNISNYLFRGNEPKILVNGKDTMAYDLLKTYLANSAKQSGFTLPTDYYLIDIKYVYTPDDPFEKPDISLEEAFFKLNPNYGEVRVVDVWGDIEDPNLMSKDDRQKKASTLSQWQHDNLPVYIPSLHDLLYTPGKRSVVIYFHCECGCDRTGEMGGSYMIKYKNITYEKVMTWNTNIAGRPIMPNHQFAIIWYCYYLNLVEGFSLTCS